MYFIGCPQTGPLSWEANTDIAVLYGLVYWKWIKTLFMAWFSSLLFRDVYSPSSMGTLHSLWWSLNQKTQLLLICWLLLCLYWIHVNSVHLAWVDCSILHYLISIQVSYVAGLLGCNMFSLCPTVCPMIAIFQMPAFSFYLAFLLLWLTSNQLQLFHCEALWTC